MVTLSALTYNIRHAVLDDGRDAWPNRRGAVGSAVEAAGADVVGLQESTGDQHADVESDLPGYDWVGVADEPGSGEHNPVGYTDRFRLAGATTEWLSETPETPGSVGWDASFARALTRASLVDTATGAVMTVFNAHFDHEGERARRESARRIRERIDDLPGSRPAVVLGDFNCRPGSGPYEILTGDGESGHANEFDRSLGDTRELAGVVEGPDTTVTDFEALDSGRRLDHVFVSDGVTVHSYEALTARGGRDRERFPSDHLPVCVDISI